ncbi:type IV toxin-antitoxin system AbiEi family antitoxin domain-containing protein [Microbacterium sp.]|uniref:type IV toxin-antitoxin system AbiEi family antitoxin domain-containing protein n=1 Tax=Microbacterium sp. TaxID=51671 RepID=UPI002C45E9D2|nr:type IV toxin-antitoxin system AbiEi family antitoxin domain-containing protein [Microbacterium sp.]HWK77336.1 type IV toxin-antitoxin system AbiEi family antitoxin domain-containing protein [Microbacterium sp.]
MDDVEVIRAIEHAPMRTVRTADIADLVTNASRTIARLVERGALTKLAHGVYTVPPDGADARHWRPPLEGGALALATARFGARAVILMGAGAARYWHAIPRAIGSTTVAVAERGVRPVELATGGRIDFVFRQVEDVDATLEHTVLGDALVTTPSQTLYDLLAMRGSRSALGEAQFAEAVTNLSERVSKPEFQRLLTSSGRVPLAARELVMRLGG